VTVTAYIVTGLLLFAYYGVPFAYMRWLRSRARTRCRKNGDVILTFDDGPSDTMSGRILDCLDKHEIHAAHFVTTSNVKNREDKIRRAAARGDIVGCHGDKHIHHWKSAPWAGIRDIRAGWARLHEITGSKTTRVPFRPPYGKLNLLSLVFLLLHRTPIAVWTIDSKDTWAQLTESAEQAAERVRSEGGGIVLLHDYDREDSAVNDFVIAVVESLAANPVPGGKIANPTVATFR
jgi:peptidoglycan/xylan/chitin deacetylase (PgdA/CDA1 family)